MVSIKVKDDAHNNQAEVTIEIQGAFTDIVCETVIGAVATVKKATGDRISYQDAVDMLHIALDDFEDFEED